MRRAWWLLVAIPLLVAFPYVRALGNPNELVRVYTAIALVDRGHYTIDDEVEEFGWTIDMAHVNGHYAMVKAPFIVWFGAPSYWIFSKVVAPALGHRERDEWWLRGATWALRLGASQLPALAFLVWFERYLRNFSADETLRRIVVIATGLGTNYLAYAHMFASHTLYAIAAFVAFACIERKHRPLLAGVLTSACVALEYQALFMTLVLVAYAAWTYRRKIWLFVLGGLVNVPPVMHFQWRAYGNPFTPGHKLLEATSYAVEHQQGLWGIHLPKLSTVAALAFDPGFGFFGMSPFMLLGLLAVPYLLWKGPRVTTLAWFGAMVAVIGVNAGFVEWRAGWTIGPRYLVVCAPFFGFGALLGLARVRSTKLAHGVAGGFALASVVTIGLVGLVVDTLPTDVQRPLAQFALPMIRAGLVPHHVGEWIGWRTPSLWYFAGAALVLAAPLVALRRSARSSAAFVACAALGLSPAFTRPRDGTALLELHPSTTWIADKWEPLP